MDQSSINRKIRSNRSWGFKRVEIESKNTNFSGSASIWMAILSNGGWLWLLTSENINSEKIVLFINRLALWLKNNDSLFYSDVILILDSYSIKKSTKVKLQFAKLNWEVLNLLVYSPIYASIENWFWLLMFYLKQNYKSEDTKINFKRNFTTIYHLLKSISAKTIKKIFGNLFIRIRNNLSTLL